MEQPADPISLPTLTEHNAAPTTTKSGTKDLTMYKMLNQQNHSQTVTFKRQASRGSYCGKICQPQPKHEVETPTLLKRLADALTKTK